MTYTLKPYPAYKPSGVGWLGEIPSGWNVAKVKYSSYLKRSTGLHSSRLRLYADMFLAMELSIPSKEEQDHIESITTKRTNEIDKTVDAVEREINALKELTLTSHPDLHVGDCVPFYFCPRSIMLYVIHMANHPELEYRGGQEPIVHLEADLRQTVDWANREERRWAFTTSNAGSRFFDDYSNLEQLKKVDWNAVRAKYWNQCKDGKQAEFLIESSFPWELVSRIGVLSQQIYGQVWSALQASDHQPPVQIKRDWYY